MVKITRVYTRKGDKGETAINKNTRLSKSSTMVEQLGLLDELNSYLGWIGVLPFDNQLPWLHSRLIDIQNALFDIGAFLCNSINEKLCIHMTDLTKQLENDMDTMNLDLPRLNSFILPGGNELSARLHIARTVCRRAECRLVTSVKVRDSFILSFINRLSDWLFVVARFITHCERMTEKLWRPCQ